MNRPPDLYVTVRGDRLLLRGISARQCARIISHDQHQWSDIGRGWVISGPLLPDCLAYAQSQHLLAVVTDLASNANTSREESA